MYACVLRVVLVTRNLVLEVGTVEGRYEKGIEIKMAKFVVLRSPFSCSAVGDE